MSRLFLSPPHMSGRELEYVRDAIESNWVAPIGPHVDAFERELAAVVGLPYAAAVSSGTAALHLALRLVGVGSGDDVICPSLTFCATANPAIYLGARPVFVDVTPDAWTLSPDELERELEDAAAQGRRVGAVIAVDLYGQCADYDAIEAVCAQYSVPLVEDAAEALGATYRGRAAGSFGSCAVFSFNGNKIITTSGGGMLVSRESELVSRGRFLATQARDPAPHYQHSTVGFNYRMSNVLAAIGRAQLEVIAERVSARRSHFAEYEAALGTIPGIAMMPNAAYGVGSHWLSCLTIDPDRFGATREDVRLALEAADIEARPVWKPLHLQPAFSNARWRPCPVSERLFDGGLCLPSGSAMTSHDRERVISIVRSCRRA